MESDASLPVRARTALAAAGRVDVRPVRPVAAATGPPRPVAVATDDDGDVYLLDGRPAAWTDRAVEVRWRPRDRSLGELVLLGRTWGALPLDDVPDLAAALAGPSSRPCGVRPGGCGGCRPADLRALRVVPVVPDRLRLETVAGPGAGLQEGVPLALFRGARPDAWAVERAVAAEHLERDHQRELRALVAHVRGPVGTSAVAVRSLADDGLVLTCLTGDGVTDVVLPFGTPVRSAAALAAWLRRNTPAV